VLVLQRVVCKFADVKKRYTYTYWMWKRVSLSAHLSRPISCTSNFGRSFSSSAPCFAGQKFRESQKVGRTGNEEGPVHDLPDYKLPDGTMGPVSKGFQRQQRKKEAEKTRIARLAKEMEEDIRSGNWQQFS